MADRARRTVDQKMEKAERGADQEPPGRLRTGGHVQLVVEAVTVVVESQGRAGVVLGKAVGRAVAGIAGDQRVGGVRRRRLCGRHPLASGPGLIDIKEVMMQRRAFLSGTIAVVTVASCGGGSPRAGKQPLSRVVLNRNRMQL
jgi:hypothetical protein